MNHKIKAVTFDLWDTVFIDESDEPKRKELGLLPKFEERRIRAYEALSKHNDITQEQVNLAYDVADTAFREVWYGQSVTWDVATRLSVLIKGAKCSLPDDEFKSLVRLHEEMELEVKPDLAPGIVEAIKGLSKEYKLGVISDTIFSSGKVLHEILVSYNLASYFDAFIFSDEAGCSKPDPFVFQEAARRLDVNVEEIAHIGDREPKDIEGPQKLGAKGIYTTVVLDRGPCPTADAQCDDYGKLVDIVNGL